mgnify:FL=1
MNNRKQSNKRGKNPRQLFTQITNEPLKLKRVNAEGEIELIDNPKVGMKRKIVHRNINETKKRKNHENN